MTFCSLFLSTDGKRIASINYFRDGLSLDIRFLEALGICLTTSWNALHFSRASREHRLPIAIEFQPRLVIWPTSTISTRNPLTSITWHHMKTKFTKSSRVRRDLWLYSLGRRFHLKLFKVPKTCFHIYQILKSFFSIFFSNDLRWRSTLHKSCSGIQYIRSKTVVIFFKSFRRQNIQFKIFRSYYVM